MQKTDVLIVGAGPTGLVLALWLQAQGVSVRIIDKTSAPGTTSRAMVVHARTLELYRQLGMADAVAAAGHPSRVVNMWARGKRRAQIDMRDFGGDITPYPYLLIFPQDHHESFLCDQLAARGLTIERNTELLDAKDEGDQVTATLRGPDGKTQTCTTRFMVGADGAASTVRKGLGGKFKGGTYRSLLYVADVEVAQDMFNGNVHLSFEETDFLLVFPYAAHIHSPAGGQGMNTGIGDAINLAWKLAAVVNGRGNDALLESYHAERAAFARTLIKTTDQAFNLASRKGSVFGFMRTYVVPNVAKLAFGLASARAAMFRAISQVAITYSDGPLGWARQGKSKAVTACRSCIWTRVTILVRSLTSSGRYMFTASRRMRCEHGVRTAMCRCMFLAGTPPARLRGWNGTRPIWCDQTPMWAARRPKAIRRC